MSRSSLRRGVVLAICTALAVASAPAQSLDLNFNPGASAGIEALALQENGRILVGGRFETLASAPRPRLGRLNANGSLDTAFAPVVSNVVECLVVQPDGKILLGGQFTSVGGQTRNRIARLNSDGSLDATFNPGLGVNNAGVAGSPNVRCLALQSDGRIVIGGSFDSVGGQARNNIARLNADGSLDAGFNPDAAGLLLPAAAPGVFCLAIQADGKILLGGQFVTIGGIVRNGFARVQADGSLDTAFNPSATPASFSTVAMQPDGKILVGGGFSRLGGRAQANLARLNPDGTADPDFAIVVNGSVNRLALQRDGRILISGFFNFVGGQPRANFARITSFGTLDSGFGFDLASSASAGLSPVNAFAAMPDDSVIVAGMFTAVADVARGNIARLTTPAPSRLANLSTRGFVAAGDVLTLGIVTRGAGVKSLLVRAVGPTLSVFGVTGALTDPRIDVIPAGAILPTGVNDDWGGDASLATAFTAVGAFPLAASSKDSALLTTIASGAMTARVTSPAPTASGIALAEAYDRDATGIGPRLVNLSVLGFVGVGVQALVPGFVIEGSASKRILIRAIGPGLAPFGVTGTVPDPQLAVIPQGTLTVVAGNDNWGGDAALGAAFAAAGAFALAPASRDAAVVVQLPPGAYSVVVSGVAAGTGRALVEIYDLDP